MLYAFERAVTFRQPDGSKASGFGLRPPQARLWPSVLEAKHSYGPVGVAKAVPEAGRSARRRG